MSFSEKPRVSLGYKNLPDLMALMTGDDKHRPSASSTLDVLWVLYDRVLNVSSDRLDDPDRDRFLLSKGHGPMAYYAVLAAKGFIPADDLAGFATYDSALGQHPDRNLIPGAEISSGSLGHGLPIAVGVTLALRSQGRRAPRVVVLLGDGELDEGSNEEAIGFAGAADLEQLTAVVVDNRSATYRRPAGIAPLFEISGWVARTVNGRDHNQLAAAIEAPHPGKPLVVVAEVEQWS